MTDAIASRPLVVHEVTRTRSVERRSLDGFELRTVGLGVAAHLLRMPVAAFDPIHVAAALADIQGCPVCRPRPRRAA